MSNKIKEYQEKADKLERSIKVTKDPAIKAKMEDMLATLLKNIDEFKAELEAAKKDKPAPEPKPKPEPTPAAGGGAKKGRGRPKKSEPAPEPKPEPEPKPKPAPKKIASGLSAADCEELLAKEKHRTKTAKKYIKKREAAGKPIKVTPAETLKKAVRLTTKKLEEKAGNKHTLSKGDLNATRGYIVDMASNIVRIEKDKEKKKEFLTELIKELTSLKGKIK